MPSSRKLTKICCAAVLLGILRMGVCRGSSGCDHQGHTKPASVRGRWPRAVVDSGELPFGSAFRVPAFLRASPLCAGFPVARADHE